MFPHQLNRWSALTRETEALPAGIYEGNVYRAGLLTDLEALREFDLEALWGFDNNASFAVATHLGGRPRRTLPHSTRSSARILTFSASSSLRSCPMILLRSKFIPSLNRTMAWRATEIPRIHAW
jgi:hypothetical protein